MGRKNLKRRERKVVNERRIEYEEKYGEQSYSDGRTDGRMDTMHTDILTYIRTDTIV